MGEVCYQKWSTDPKLLFSSSKGCRGLRRKDIRKCPKQWCHDRDKARGLVRSNLKSMFRGEMVEGETLRGPCDASTPRHLVDVAPLASCLLHTFTRSSALAITADRGSRVVAISICIHAARSPPEVQMSLHPRPLPFACISFMGPYLAVGHLSR